MHILSLVENSAVNGCRAKHGLSLYIETARRRLLFDLGPDDTLFHNARKMGVDLAQVDTVVLSHGHFDHGGALAQFLEANKKAKVYLQAGAFEPRFTRAGLLKIPIGLDVALRQNDRIVTLRGDARLDEELYLFTVPEQTVLRSPMNNVLLDRNGKDAFLHEQNLIVTENGVSVLIMGCGHAGIANIMETAFYTCHCTGKKAYRYLHAQAPKLAYLACGQSLVVPENRI